MPKLFSYILGLSIAKESLWNTWSLNRKINKFEEISYNNITSTTKIINACISQNIYKKNWKAKNLKLKLKTECVKYINIQPIIY